MENVEKYIGKWYTFNICGTKIIILVTGFDDTNTKYEGDSFVGRKTIIMSNGYSLNKDWACSKKSFISNIESGDLREFEF